MYHLETHSNTTASSKPQAKRSDLKSPENLHHNPSISLNSIKYSNSRIQFFHVVFVILIFKAYCCLGMSSMAHFQTSHEENLSSKSISSLGNAAEVRRKLGSKIYFFEFEIISCRHDQWHQHQPLMGNINDAKILPIQNTLILQR